MLRDKTVFISGGTGFIGSALVRACAGYGARVFFTYYKGEDSANKLMDEIKGSKGIRLDLRDIGDIEKKVAALYDEAGRIDVLVNNAAVSQVMPLAMLEEEDVDGTFDINIKGTLFLTKAVVRGMIKFRGGSIVNIGSIAGHRMLDVPVHYAMSKAALQGLTFSLSAELKRFGIRVNSVVPGLIEDGVSKKIPDRLKEDFNRHCAAGRPGTGAEVAETVCFIASDRAGYINGQNIFVDGGI